MRRCPRDGSLLFSYDVPRAAQQVFHPAPGVHDDVPYAWTEPYYHAKGFSHWDNFSHSWAAFDVDDEVMPDGQLAQNAVQQLRTAASAGKPFFVAVGFHKVPCGCGTECARAGALTWRRPSAAPSVQRTAAVL